MQDKGKLKLVLYWHMHQPDYRNVRTGAYLQPWTYLHTIKDYSDMAIHLEANPNAKVVVNFTPILLEQIDDYDKQLKSHLNNGTEIKDPLLNALAGSSLTKDPEERIELINYCQKVNQERVINRFPAYKRLTKLHKKINSDLDITSYINDQYIYDLLVWYHLGWLAENSRREDIRIKRLQKKEKHFDIQDRKELIVIISELISLVIPQYKDLASKKQIELSTTPYTHPIVPLLLDLESAKDAMPDVELPDSKLYPDGENRAKWQIRKGIQIFKNYFGFEPQGCWPSEGAVCDRTSKLLQECGYKWLASGAGVFWNSVNKAKQNSSENSFLDHQPNHINGQNITCFFRDDQLSDLIGFEYSSWHAEDAVANLTHHLSEIAKKDTHNEDTIVSIILDGENAWEHYPENGYYFLDTLYAQLSKHPDIELITYSDYLAEKDRKKQILPGLVTGSWVYGTLSTWIGSKDKNKGWDMLCDAKACFDEVINSGRLSKNKIDQATQQLAICEGSDWFWWFGDYNSAETVSDFEKLFRYNLTNLYTLLGSPAPDYLASTFTYGQSTPEGGGTMRRSGENN